MALFHIIQIVNFFFLAFALLSVYYYAFRLRIELKKSDELRRSAEKYKALINSSSEGVFRCDYEGKIMLMNDAGAKILGYRDQEELLQNGLKTIEIYKNPSEREESIKELIQHGSVKKRLVKARRDGGELFDLEFSANTVFDKDNSNVIGFEGLFRDVTSRVRLENELMHYSERLEEKVEEEAKRIVELELQKCELSKLASMGEMAATIVHEIRNPLSSIKMGLTTLLKRVTLQEKDRQCLELSAREVTHLERILKDLLNFSKPGELQLTRQDINQVLDLAVNQMAIDFKNSGIALHRNLALDLPRVSMDMNRLLQVFYNILLNAKQAVLCGGLVSIRSFYLQEKECVRVEISDDGKGIRQEDMDKIFIPFFSTKHEGTGLGLTIVNSIVEAHGGKVCVVSEIDKGTNVWIDFPVDGALQEDQRNDSI
jgi:two-component system sensor histidine kinase HydH